MSGEHLENVSCNKCGRWASACVCDTPSSFAASTGSASPDCCAQWSRSAWRLNVTVIRSGGMRSELDVSIRFCPWCGRARPNKQITDS